MPVPFEAVIPMVLVGALFGVTGTGYSLISRAANDGKPPRYNVDEWERMMIRRDYRLTGSKRGQAVRRDPIADPSFATNSFWSTEKIA
ncbi:hypothetical protein MCUN1_003551 [Malassezia cuniculi]|uniref:NADH dehydrogenase [ubiquinone] 1 alpha subcomplex subunit 1 n=1 Tax=Malassezia cuniculi TaxID=948313 RepID=A0AAF0EY87_9BASI|nr:hypothetical protein MCUN1_003551 [Malassezia cuniculi]